jgi:threonyl-tRNA synthetase
MRFLIWHVDSFRSTVTQRGRSPLVEEVPPEGRTTEVGEALLVLASVERGDEGAPQTVAEGAAAEIDALARQLKVGTIVLHSFAHLFAELAAPATAVEVLDLLRERLQQRGYVVARTPFGWFNTLEIKAKGHPLSRVARTVRPDLPASGAY